MRQPGGRCAISLPTRLATGVDYLGPMLTLTASAASIMIESGCCEAQSTGVNNRRRCVIGARGLHQAVIARSAVLRLLGALASLGSLTNSSMFSISRPILLHAINCLKPSGILIWTFDGRCAAFVIVTGIVRIAADSSGWICARGPGSGRTCPSLTVFPRPRRKPCRIGQSSPRTEPDSSE